MIKNLLKKLGYIKANEIRDLCLPRDVVDSIVINSLDSEFDTIIPKKDEKKLFEDLAELDNFLVYLELLMNRDVKRFFKTTYDSDEQKEIRGMFARAYSLRSLCTYRKAEDKPKLVSNRTL